MPTTSDNGVPGTWSPNINSQTTTAYVFTPAAGQCATLATQTISIGAAVNAQITNLDNTTVLSCSQSDITFSGHASECRFNAENARTFRPSPGLIKDFHVPGGLGVRVDSAAYSGYRIPPHYDSLIGKLIVHGKNRTECLMRLRRSLSEFVIDGIETTIPLFQALVNEKDIIDGDYSIHWLEKYLKRQQEQA